MTKEQLVSDVILRVTKGKPSDDLELEPRQVAFWIDLVLPAVVKSSIEEVLKSGGTVDPIYIQYEECINPQIKDSSCAECQNNVFIELCKNPISLMKDRGVLRVTTQDGVEVNKTTIEEIDVINKLSFSKPTLSNLVYHREKGRLYIHGADNRSYQLLQFNVWFIPAPQLLEDLADTDEVAVAADIIGMISTAVEEIARRQVYQGVEDEENDSEQDMNQARQ